MHCRHSLSITTFVFQAYGRLQSSGPVGVDSDVGEIAPADASQESACPAGTYCGCKLSPSPVSQALGQNSRSRLTGALPRVSARVSIAPGTQPGTARGSLVAYACCQRTQNTECEYATAHNVIHNRVSCTLVCTTEVYDVISKTLTISSYRSDQRVSLDPHGD